MTAKTDQSVMGVRDADDERAWKKFKRRLACLDVFLVDLGQAKECLEYLI